MQLIAVVIVLALGPFIRATDRMRELPDEQLRIQCSLGILYDALIAEDSDVILGLIFVADDPGQTVAKAQVRRLIANTRFVRAIEKLNLPHGFNPFERTHIVYLDDFAFATLTGEWRIDGDTAVMLAEQRMGGPDQPAPPPLIRVRGIWKLNLTPSPLPKSMEALAIQIQEYAAVVERTAGHVESGKLTTVEQVKETLARGPQLVSAQNRLALVLSASADAPQPSSRPSR